MNPPTEQTHHSRPAPGRGENWIIRRDRVLLVLHDRAGLSHQDISQLTADQVTVGDGTATIIAGARTVTLTADPDTVTCGPCTLARWLHTLTMTLVYADHRVTTAVITRSAPPAAGSPHPCLHPTDTMMWLPATESSASSPATRAARMRRLRITVRAAVRSARIPNGHGARPRRLGGLLTNRLC